MLITYSVVLKSINNNLNNYSYIISMILACVETNWPGIVIIKLL